MSETFEYVVVGLGALGSSAAYHLARRGHRVLGLEQFELGHPRGASHDTSRILRHSYHTPAYVRLTFDAYDDWARLERESGVRLVTRTGGLDLFPADPAIAIADYTRSLGDWGVPYELLDADAVAVRWPQFRLPPGAVGLFQARASVVPAARGTAVMQDRAEAHGAVLRDRAPVTSVRDLGAAGVQVTFGAQQVRCRRLVVCTDAWTNQVLAGLDWQVPLEVTLEQATYFRPPHPEQFEVGRFPLWIWMDDPSFYGFPCYGEPTVKAAQDCGGPSTDPDERTFDVDPERLDLARTFVRGLLPGAGEPVRSIRCLYTLTPDRDFVLGAVPGHESVLVGLGAGHGFKFAPTLGRLLADLAVAGDTEADVAAFRPDRAALSDPTYAAHWLV
jgi:sarcosine oxidase